MNLRSVVLSEIIDAIQKASGKEILTFGGIETLDFLRQSYSLDSLDFVEIIMGLEEKFDISIPDGELEKLVRLDDLIDSVVKKCQDQTPPSTELFEDKIIRPSTLAETAANTSKVNKFATFLYFLMRDYVPVGVVPKIIEDIPDCDLVFTNKDLYNIAVNYAKLLE